MVPFERAMPPKNPAKAPIARAPTTAHFLLLLLLLPLLPLLLLLWPPLVWSSISVTGVTAEPIKDGSALMLMLSSAVPSTAVWLFAWLLAVILVLAAGTDEKKGLKNKSNRGKCGIEWEKELKGQAVLWRVVGKREIKWKGRSVDMEKGREGRDKE